MPGLHEHVDDQTGRSLDGDGNVGSRRQAGEPSAKLRKSDGVMGDLDAQHDSSGFVDDADGMAGAAPVQSSEKWHGQSLLGCATLPRVGRFCGTLINRRSGPYTLALHPVARHALPAPAMRRVSFWPSAGKRLWPSCRALGAGRAFHPACGVKSSTNPMVH